MYILKNTFKKLNKIFYFKKKKYYNLILFTT